MKYDPGKFKDEAYRTAFVNSAWTYNPLLEGMGCPYTTPTVIGPPRAGGPTFGVAKCGMHAGHDGLHQS